VVTSPDDLEAELRALAGALDTPAPPAAEVARKVRDRLEATPPPAARRPPFPVSQRVRRALGNRRRLVTALAALLVALLVGATPQGRAAVAEILRFAGIEMRIGAPAPAVTGTPSKLPGEHPVTLDEARRMVGFPIAVPAELGEPREVRVSDEGRVVSLFWPGIRLDEYDGTLSVVFRKELGPPYPEQFHGGWWIPQHHGLTYVPRDGSPAVVTERLAGPTLVTQRKFVGLRLEGVAERHRAEEIISSLR
jgi:hypothetical protein